MKFHDTLNDKIWDIENDNQILPEVKDKLEEIASAFIEYLEIPQDAILDKVITGSSASYNYNNFSDLDLHIIVDYDKIHEDCPLVEGYLGALKNTFNKEHDIYIHGIPVELYAEKKDQGTVHNGLYSLNSGWVDFPEKIAPTDNDAAVEAKYQEIKEMVDRCDDSETATELLEKIYTMRKAGLASSGEFCTENLAFKRLRNEGCMDKLREIKKKDIDKQLSLESYNEDNTLIDIIDRLISIGLQIDGSYKDYKPSEIKYAKEVMDIAVKKGFVFKEEDQYKKEISQSFAKLRYDLLNDKQVIEIANKAKKDIDKQLSLESYNESLEQDVKELTKTDDYYKVDGSRVSIKNGFGSQVELMDLQNLGKKLEKKGYKVYCSNYYIDAKKNESIKEDTYIDKYKSIYDKATELAQDRAKIDFVSIMNTQDLVNYAVKAIKQNDADISDVESMLYKATYTPGEVEDILDMIRTNLDEGYYRERDKNESIKEELEEKEYQGCKYTILPDGKYCSIKIYAPKGYSFKNGDTWYSTETELKNADKKAKDIIDNEIELKESIKEDTKLNDICKLVTKLYGPMGPKKGQYNLIHGGKNAPFGIKLVKELSGKGATKDILVAKDKQELMDKLTQQLNKNESINESSVIDKFKEMANKIAADFKVEGYPKSNKYLLDFVDEATKKFSEENKGYLLRTSTDNGEAVITLCDMNGEEDGSIYQARINGYGKCKVRFTDLENSNYAYESLKEGLDKMVNKAMNESVMDTDIELIDSWLTKLGFEDAQGPQGYVFMRKTGDKLERIIIDNDKLTYTKGEEKKEFPFSNTIEIQKAFKALNEGKEINEDLKTIWKNEMKRDPIIDTPDGPIYLQPSEDGKSIEFGTMTNNGMIVDGSVEYDFDYSLDTNLDTVYDEIRDYYELYLVPEEDRDQVVTDEKEDRLSDLFPESKNEDIETLTDKVDQAHNDLKDLIKSLSNKIEEALTEPVEIGTRVGTPDGQVTGTVKEVNTVTKEVKIETDEVPGKPKEEKTFKIDQLDNIIKEALQ